jgi:hypothetical protein
MAEFADDGDCADWLAPAAANSYGTQPGLPQADKMALDNCKPNDQSLSKAARLRSLTWG